MYYVTVGKLDVTWWIVAGYLPLDYAKQKPRHEL